MASLERESRSYSMLSMVMVGMALGNKKPTPACNGGGSKVLDVVRQGVPAERTYINLATDGVARNQQIEVEGTDELDEDVVVGQAFRTNVDIHVGVATNGEHDVLLG